MFTGQKNFIEAFKSLRTKSKNLSILLVEDDPLIRAEYVNFFGRIFYSIDKKNNGAEGLDAVLTKQYDLIITDVQMPVMNGLDMIKKIKEIYPKQPTLIVSAFQDSDILHKSVQLGVDGYIFKPMDMEVTISLLDKIVSHIIAEKDAELYKNNLEELVIVKTNELLSSYTIDKVTNLYSLAKLQQDIAISKDESLTIIKIKNFKSLNDFYGYEIGNSILLQIANLLSKMFLKNPLIAHSKLYRISGTHFAILTSLDAVVLVNFIEKIVHEFESTEVVVHNQLMYLEMNAAIVCRTDGITLSDADKALRMAEKNSKVVIYKKDKNLIKAHALNLQCNDSIKRALIDERFVPFYHPIVDNKTNSIRKYEALARLIMPDGEIISPGCFLPVSKQTKTYNMITIAIIKQALQDFRDSECSVSLNLSMDDIQNKNTREFLFKQISMFPEPSRLIFELLESEHIDHYEDVDNFFLELKQFGCKVAIDDFGSGYANFEHIAKLKVDYIKIDGSLIMEMENKITSLTIVEMLSSFALKMGIKTIAEYVSSDLISKIVNSIGIHESQGFLFGEPIPYDTSMKYIKNLSN